MPWPTPSVTGGRTGERYLNARRGDVIGAGAKILGSVGVTVPANSSRDTGLLKIKGRRRPN
jgi:hypothetical protein